ncbi:MAG: 50S ribosomal protein L13 [Rickettsiaceae bacterium]|nr:50S ribosomal protein L13 [Rickettsiaceae bacterium]MDP4832556.1 50S ribosomal protein L13 [Rickettsiaceae bacterium]MDP5020202.1 50S ribosomal protein L13 [Rickettsiaceae bacterium]MDP5082902.1 50S ribosomal protein L13 [Rickettsiaceae bacterium]
MKTYSAKSSEIEKKWLIIDAKDIVLGRLASQVALLLRGKHKPTFTPHMDCGDHVVIINAQQIHLSGKKGDKKDGKFYYRHTGFPGGIKETTAGKILLGNYPERVVQMAVNRMISRNKLGRKQFSNLHVYAGSEHPHTAQQPVTFDIAEKNPKNKK